MKKRKSIIIPMMLAAAVAAASVPWLSGSAHFNGLHFFQ